MNPGAMAVARRFLSPSQVILDTRSYEDHANEFTYATLPIQIARQINRLHARHKLDCGKTIYAGQELYDTLMSNRDIFEMVNNRSIIYSHVQDLQIILCADDFPPREGVIFMNDLTTMKEMQSLVLGGPEDFK